MTRTFSSLGLMIGTIIGAGMFALPYAVVRVGIFWGVFHLFFTFCILTLIHIFYSIVVSATPGKHRLPGYARIHLGVGAERFAFFSAFGGFYGALLVYGILGGIFLSRLFPFFEGGAVRFTFLFFVVGALVLLCNIRHVGELNFFLTFILIAVVGVFAFLLLPHMEFSNFQIISHRATWFLPYGIFLFAFAGASAVPDAAETFYRGQQASGGHFRRVLVLSTGIPLLVYLVFITSVVGVSGQATSPDAIFGLEAFLGKRAVLLGSLVGFLAVFTSYIALGLDLKNMFRYDMGVSSLVAWAGVAAIPPILFFAGINDFVSLIGLVGAVAIGIDGILILLSALHVCRTGSRCVVGGVSFRPIFPLVLIIALAIGAGYELFNHLP